MKTSLYPPILPTKTNNPLAITKTQNAGNLKKARAKGQQGPLCTKQEIPIFSNKCFPCIKHLTMQLSCEPLHNTDRHISIERATLSARHHHKMIDRQKLFFNLSEEIKRKARQSKSYQFFLHDHFSKCLIFFDDNLGKKRLKIIKRIKS